MIILNYQDRRPLYEQVTEKFRALILSGALPPGSRLPSVRQLAMELSINPNTIQRAYMALEQEKLVYPVKGKGNYVAESEEIRKASCNTWLHEFQSLVKKGIGLGIEKEKLLHLVEGCYREEKR